MWGSFSSNSTYTNIAVLESLYKTGNEEENKFHYCLYVEGSGADTDLLVLQHISSYIKEAKDIVGNLADNIKSDFSPNTQNTVSKGDVSNGAITGLGFGIGSTGVAEKCRIMARRVKTIYEKYFTLPNVGSITLHFDVFGFSRGATTARLFTYIINPTGENQYDISNDDYKLFTGTDRTFLPCKKEKGTSKIESKEVRYLGIYDTVSSIGILNNGVNKILADKLNLDQAEEFKDYGKSLFHEDNVADFGLYATEKAKHLLHICAMDENRANFALVDISNSLSQGSEIFIPGCHTDIGGGCALGQDSIKILNCEIITNKDVIFSDAYSKLQQGVEIARNAKATLAAIESTINGVQTIVSGIKMCTHGATLPSGALVALNGAKKTYDGTKTSLLKMHETAMQVNKLFVEASDQIDIIDPIGKKQIDNTIANLQSKGLFEKIGDAITNQIGFANNITTNVGTIKTEAEEIVEDFKKTETSDSLLNKVESTSDMASKACDTVIQILDIVDNVTKAAKTIKNDVADIQSYVYTKYPNVTAMGVLSAEVAALGTKIKSLYTIANRTVQTLHNTLVGRKKKLFAQADKQTIYLLNKTPHTKPQFISPSNILPVSSNSLRELGWGAKGENDYNRDNLTFSGRAEKEYLAEHNSETVIINKTRSFGKKDINNVAIYKYAHVGYSNIALRAMFEWTKDGNIFNAIPNGQYEVPSDLKELADKVNLCASTTGRHFCEPATYHQYRLTRCKYLHFSSNQQILSPADNGLVNGVSLKSLNNMGLLLTRRIYSGEMVKPVGDKYMCDYSNGNICPANIKITGIVEK